MNKHAFDKQMHFIIEEFWQYQEDYRKNMVKTSNQFRDNERKIMYDAAKEILADQQRTKIEQASILKKIA
jgi:hypothetical protein